MILDATCGCKGMYKGDRGKYSCQVQPLIEGQEIIYLDIRNGIYIFKTSPNAIQPRTRRIHIFPTVQGDFTHLPFKDKVFNLVIFDPPHAKFTERLANRYGSFDWDELKQAFVLTGIEFYRVLQPQGLVLMKLSDVSFDLTKLAIWSFCWFKLFWKFDLQRTREKHGSHAYILLFMKAQKFSPTEPEMWLKLQELESPVTNEEVIL